MRLYPFAAGPRSEHGGRFGRYSFQQLTLSPIMASNLDYLNPALVPLEQKVDAYLEAEKALRHVTQAGSEASSAAEQPGQLRRRIAQLEQEILALLPTRDEWVKVNLGYGPSRVGAWQVPAPDGGTRYEVRVVH